MTPRRWQADLALAGVALVWGATFVLVKGALADISPALFIAIRFSIAATVLVAIVIARGSLRLTRPAILGGALAGVFLCTGYILQTAGLKLTTPAKSGFITGLYIPLIPVFSAVFYRRLPLVAECAGIALAAVGMGLMTLNFEHLVVGTGDLLTFGCAIAFAVHMLVLGHYSTRMDSGLLAFLQVATCAALAAVSVPWIEEVRLVWSSEVIVALGVTSLLATALAFFVQTWGQRHTTTTRTALIFALEPVFAWLTSYLLADELLTVQAVVGAACILLGILLVELKPGGTRAAQHL